MWVEVDDYFVSGDSMSEANEAEITESFQDTSTSVETGPVSCTTQCCIPSDEPYQSINKKTLINIYYVLRKGILWHKQFLWVSVCIRFIAYIADMLLSVICLGEQAFAETDI